ncbi:MAG: gluconate 2-dehydrogenase subunit 3 family protein [Thermoanaerobaculia bacterium]
MTVALPHVLLAPIGAALARRAARARNAVFFGAALAAALQPLASLTGDAYEAASIPITRLARVAGFSAAFDLRGDDVAKVAARAAALGSPAAWTVLVAGCLGGVALVALLLVVSGGVAPRPETVSSPGWTRRDFVRGLLGAAALAAGAWILKRVFLPGRLSASDRATLETLLDTLIPDGRYPGHRATGVLPKLLPELEGSRQTRRALIEGIELLDRGARRVGSPSFRELAPPKRAELVREIARAEEGTLPRFFYQSVRNRAMEIHYANPASWEALRFTHAPQPEGYPDFAERPGV